MTAPPPDVEQLELDVRGMRVLTHPVRLALLRRLQEHGPSTAARLSAFVGASPAGTSWHLRQLAAHGLVREADDQSARREHGRERWWQAAGRGFRFAADETTEGTDAAIALAALMNQVDGDVFARWQRESEPRLDAGWRRRVGRSSTVVLVTPEELDAVRRDIDALLAPYARRKYAHPVPDGTRPVRVVRYLLPEPAREGGSATR